jgi:PAS domain S-box-containing protein
VTLGTGLCVLGGWAFGFPDLTRVTSDGSQMVALTALGFVLVGAALLLHRQELDLSARLPTDRLRSASDLVGMLIIVVGTTGLITRMLGWNVRLEALSIEPLAEASRAGTIGSMSAATGVGFVLLGLSLLFARRAQHAIASQVAAILALLIGWIGFSRYAYGGEPLLPYAAMAIHTAVLLMVASAGVLSLRHDAGLMRPVTRRRVAGLGVRTLLPAAIFVPLLAGALALHASRAQWLGIETAVSLLAVVIVIILAGLTWTHAAILDRSDLQRERALHELQAVEERTRLIVENALDAVIAIDQRGVIVGWSGRAEEIFGWAQGEVLNRQLADTIVPERFRESHRAGLARYLTTGEQRVLNRRVEIFGLRRDGTEFPIELAITPIMSAEGPGFSAFVRDITEQREARLALQSSEERLRTLAESLPNLVWTCRSDGWCDFLSLQWVQYTGRPAVEQLGYGWAEHLHPEDRPRVQAEWEAAVRQSELYDTEFRIRRGDGVYRWFKTRAVPLRDQHGQIVKWFGSNTDFEDFKRADERLRAQLQHLSLLDRTTRAIAERQDLGSIFQVVLRSLEDRLPVDFACVCCYDTAENVMTASHIGAKSRPLAQQLSLSEHAEVEFDSKTLEQCLGGELVYHADIAGDGSSLSTRLARGNLRCAVFAPLIVDGKLFGVLVTARCAPDGFTSHDCEFLSQLSQHVALAAHQTQLYTALESAYISLRETQQALVQQERLRALGQIASGIAHDINNALSPALMYAQLLLERDLGASPESRKWLGVVKRAIEDVAHTVSRMREFYRPQDAEQLKSPLDLNILVEQVIALTRARWEDMPQEHGAVIELIIDRAPRLPAVFGIEAEIRDALTNLIFNAVDAMPAGGKLTLRTSTISAATGTPGTSDIPKVVVEVIDTGVGMDEAAKTRCLEPFYTTKGERGTGLGLAMVYGMAQRHDAQIEIDSSVGKGTLMRLIFPVHASKSVTTPQPEARAGRSLRILLVDDDPLVIEALRAVLVADGHRVKHADDGRAGIALFEKLSITDERVDLVITDLGMPHLDGRAVASAIKSIAPSTPVFLLTGWGHRMLMDNEIPDKVDRVFAKPPKVHELRAALAELAGQAV